MVRCRHCGAENESATGRCSVCNAPIEPTAPARPGTSGALDWLRRSRDDDRADEADGGWNWLAFLFGPLWYLALGMWEKGVAVFVGGALLSGSLAWLGSAIAALVDGIGPGRLKPGVAGFAGATSGFAFGGLFGLLMTAYHCAANADDDLRIHVRQRRRMLND